MKTVKKLRLSSYVFTKYYILEIGTKKRKRLGSLAQCSVYKKRCLLLQVPSLLKGRGTVTYLAPDKVATESYCCRQIPTMPSETLCLFSLPIYIYMTIVYFSLSLRHPVGTVPLGALTRQLHDRIRTLCTVE